MGRISLKNLLVAPFALLMITTVGVVGYLSYLNGRSAVNRLSEQLLDEINARIALNLREYVSVPHHINQVNAKSIRLGQLNIEDTKKLEGYFLNQVLLFPKISFVGMGMENKNNLGAERYDDGQLTLRLSTPETGHIFFTLATDESGKHGRVIHQIPFDPRTRPWYKAAVKNGKAAWGPIYPNTAGTTSYLGASLPVYDDRGRLLGVLLANFSLTSISNYLRSLPIARSGLTFVVERTGGLVATSSPEKPFRPRQKDFGTERVLATESTHPLTRLIALTPQFTSITSPQFMRLQGQDQPYFVKVRPFTDDYGLDWLIVTAVPESDFASEINQNTTNTIILSLFALAVTMGLAIVMSRLLNRPIMELTTCASTMSKGNLDQHLPPSPIEELNRLGQSFNSMAGQLKTAFDTLEDKVQQRTQDLAQANAEILSLNDKLKEENLRMGAELSILKAMQQMILPKTHELRAIEGLDLAGYMQPADEVGGDYYDVLENKGIVTVTIGDVTGHGLESGILMLMTQTAVRTLKEISEYDHLRFLDTLNRTIYKNVQRMNSDKNLTLAILNYADGRVSISGQHEEVIFVKQDGTIERIDTLDLGFPIGLDDDISNFVGQISLELEWGDGIVLYTDGVTEAENVHREQYGMERLCRALQTHWHLTAEQIRDAVIKELYSYIADRQVLDDITLLVIKRENSSQVESAPPVGVAQRIDERVQFPM